MKTATRIDRSRIDAAKFAYSAARIDRASIKTLLQGKRVPRAGDLLLARVVEIEQHKQIDLSNGRKSHLFLGEDVVVCYGNSYVPDQYEAVVPHSLEVCSLVSAGGIAAKMLSYHEKMKYPTSLEPIGLLGDGDGEVLNLSHFSLPRQRRAAKRPFTIAVMGSGMMADETTYPAYLTRGLKRSGLSVGAAQVIGTGSGQYIWHMLDAGADQALDFTHAGLPSTYMAPDTEIQRVYSTLTDELSSQGVDVIVLEISGGIYQKETAQLLESELIRGTVDSIIVTASDAMGAVAGVHWLKEKSLPVIAVTGAVTDSPLALRETRCITELPVLDRQSLTSTNWKYLLEKHLQSESNANPAFRISIDRLDAMMSMPVSMVC